MRESYIEREVKRRFPAAMVLKTHVRHWPDTVFFLPDSRVVLIEFKAPGELPRPGQVCMIERLRKLGFPVYVVDSVDEGLEILESNLTAL